jgi:hypothetical protein
MVDLSIVMLVYQRVILTPPFYGPKKIWNFPTKPWINHGFKRGCEIKKGKGISM